MMDERNLAEKVKAISKALGGNEPASNVVSLLNTLKNDAAPSEDALRSTKAGVVIGKLRSNASKEVARAAAEVVIKWKKAVEAEKAKARGGGGAGKASTPTRASSSTPAPSSSTTPSGGGAPTSKPFTGDTERRRYDTDGVEVNGRTESKTRDSCIGLLYNGLAYRSQASVDEVLARAVEVEKAALLRYKGETADYRNKIRSLFQNLKNKMNRDLGRRVLSGEIQADRFVVMSHEELRSAEQRKQDAEYSRENMKKAQVPMAEKSISDALRCGKCGQKKVSYSQAQTRSADEPMTTFCECTVCGNRWKFS